jgi:hypothetical protein
VCFKSIYTDGKVAWLQTDIYLKKDQNEFICKQRNIKNILVYEREEWGEQKD